MRLIKLSDADQAKYMQLLRAKALQDAKTQDPALFDPQGRLIVEVQLTQQELEGAGFDLEDEEIEELAEHITTVSFDVNSDESLKKAFYTQVEDALKHALSEAQLQKKFKKEDKQLPDVAKVVKALQNCPKGSIISLHQEYNFHLKLAARVYGKSVEQLKGIDLSPALDSALARTNKLVMRQYGLALAKAYTPEGKIDISRLNKELNKARKEMADSAHRILRDEIRLQTGIELDKESILKDEVEEVYNNQKRAKPKKEPDREKIRQHLLTELAESTVASEHDLLHLDAGLGIATLIEGCTVTAHHRKIMEDDEDEELASRQIIRHQLTPEGIFSFPHSRVQIRIPALDAKDLANHSEEDHIKDVQTKLEYIQENYLQEKKPPFFIYNLYTSLEHTLDDKFKDNLQTQGARHILMGAHLFNAEALENGTAFCFVQNIPVNGFGSTLGYGRLKSNLVEEATLMTDISLMHSLLAKDDPKLIELRGSYEAYLKDKAYLKENPPKKDFFVVSSYGEKAREIIEEIKTNLIRGETLPVPVKKDQILDNAKAYLKHILAHNLHHQDEYTKLAQALSVFIEDYSIGGCKSANERAQAINGRVLILDSLLIKAPLAPLNDERDLLLKALAKPNDPAGLKAALDGAYNALGLQSALSLISFLDQGAAAKGLAKLPITSKTLKEGVEKSFNGNYFEEETLTNLSQSKSGAMQAHKGLTSKMLSACDDSHSEKLEEATEEQLAQQAKLETNIGDYSSYGKAESVEDLDEAQFINDRLSVEGKKQLYAGIEDYENSHYAAIIKYCDAFKLPIPADSADFFRKQFLELCVTKKFEQFSGDKNLRKTKPESAAKTLEELFGEQGAELYKLALKEERHTTEFMNAVFYESTTHSGGEKWATRPVIIVAGPSACGKSTAASAAIDQANGILPKDPTNTDGNYIVAADGGVAREISQMRKLAIQVATEQGYSGILDLHKKSNTLSDVKDCILEAAFATESLGVVIPETFAKGNTSAKLFAQIDKLKNTTPIWLRVTGENTSFFKTLIDKISTTFKEVVAYMGSRRAFKTSGYKDESDNPDSEPNYDLNISKDSIPESKIYGIDIPGIGKTTLGRAIGGAVSFFSGWFGSLKAEQNFKDHYKDGMNYTLINDLVLLKPGKGGSKQKDWVEGKAADEGVIMVSRATYKAWLADGANNDSLPKYAKDHRKTFIYTDGQLLLEGAKKELAEAHQKASADPELRVILDSVKQKIEDPKQIDSTIKIDALLTQIETFTKNKPANSALTTTIEALEKRYREVKIIEHMLENKKVSGEETVLYSQWKTAHDEQRVLVDQLFVARKPIAALQEALINLKQAQSQSTMTGALVQSEDAALLQDDIMAISNECEAYAKLLAHQKEKLQGALDLLDDKFSPTQLRGTIVRSEVAAHRSLLVKQMQQITKIEEFILAPLDTLLNAEDEEGLNAKIASAAKAEEQSFRLVSTFVISSEDKNSRKELVQKYDDDLDELQEKTTASFHASEYDSIPMLQESNLREHTVKVAGSNKKLGMITEIHHRKGLASEGNQPTITYSADPIVAQDPKEKILYAFAMASKMLADLKQNPSAKNQITLNGYDKEGLEFLFTALMVLGDKSDMKFNKDAIRVRSLVFDAKNETGKVMRYSSNSCYNKHFKDEEDLINSVVKDFDKLLKDKQSLALEQKAVTSGLTDTTHKFKTHMDKLKGEAATSKLKDEDEDEVSRALGASSNA